MHHACTQTPRHVRSEMSSCLVCWKERHHFLIFKRNRQRKQNEKTRNKWVKPWSCFLGISKDVNLCWWLFVVKTKMVTLGQQFHHEIAKPSNPVTVEKIEILNLCYSLLCSTRSVLFLCHSIFNFQVILLRLVGIDKKFRCTLCTINCQILPSALYI